MPIYCFINTSHIWQWIFGSRVYALARWIIRSQGSVRVYNCHLLTGMRVRISNTPKAIISFDSLIWTGCWLFGLSHCIRAFLSRMQNCQTVSSRTHHNLINLCLLRTLRSDKYLPGLDLNRHSIQFSYVKFIVSPFCVWIIIWERLSMEIRPNWQRAKMPCNCCGVVEYIVMTSSVDCSLFEENGNNIVFYGGLNTNWASIKCVAMWWNMVYSMEYKIG